VIALISYPWLLRCIRLSRVLNPCGFRARDDLREPLYLRERNTRDRGLFWPVLKVSYIVWVCVCVCVCVCVGRGGHVSSVSSPIWSFNGNSFDNVDFFLVFWPAWHCCVADVSGNFMPPSSFMKGSRAISCLRTILLYLLFLWLRPQTRTLALLHQPYKSSLYFILLTYFKPSFPTSLLTCCLRIMSTQAL
jgi:hypothetical protein